MDFCAYILYLKEYLPASKSDKGLVVSFLASIILMIAVIGTARRAPITPQTSAQKN